MDTEQVIAALERAGKPATAAIYRRHGAVDPVLGVPFAEIGKIRKKLRVDHALARALWASGVAEARVLALQVADPEVLTRAEAEDFLAAPGSRFLTGYLASLVAKAPFAASALGPWTRARDEATRELGYTLLAVRLKDDPEALTGKQAEDYLARIEKGIHASPNRARHAMNNAVIAIGVFRPDLREAALATAGRIGKVEVDHGETGCKTPDAVAYIGKAAKRHLGC